MTAGLLPLAIIHDPPVLCVKNYGSEDNLINFLIYLTWQVNYEPPIIFFLFRDKGLGFFKALRCAGVTEEEAGEALEHGWKVISKMGFVRKKDGDEFLCACFRVWSWKLQMGSRDLDNLMDESF
ncbi:UNVERIFIED_CONTAM: hypothetical protein K2H54_064572 [Gekko kuhli]